MDEMIEKQENLTEQSNNLEATASTSTNTTAIPHPLTEEQAPHLKENDELLDMSDDFDFDDFQVVRREFFAHLREPSITFNECKFSVNAACLSKFPNANYAQVLVNREKKILALRPCEEGARDSFPWCNNSNGKRKTRAITCKIFFAKIVDLMGWNPDYKYKILGKLIHANGEYLLVFDLNSTEVYQRTIKEGEKPKTSRTAIYPANWQNQFGMTLTEHKQQSMKISLFDGYAIYSIKEENKTISPPPPQNATNDTVSQGPPDSPLGAVQQTLL